MNKPRLFIVEDEAIVATDVAIRLAQLGYVVVGTAASGEEALAQIEQCRPELVLMDIQLQGSMDGIATAREVRRRFRLPVVFLTAYAEGSTFQRAKLAEPFGYILKPFEDRELDIVIDLALYKHQAELKIQRIEQRHQTIIQTTMDGFWLMDVQGRLLEVNETYCRMSGYNMPELLAMEVGDLEASESAAETASHIRKIMEQGVDRFESKHRRKDGSVFEVEVSVLLDPHGEKEMVVFIRDITERRLIKAEIQKLNAELEQRVVERTAQLEAANKELEAFSYSVSHDLRSPLRAVDGYTHILVDDYAPQLDAEGQRLCAVISKSAKNMGKLIDDLLAFSRIGRAAVQCMPIDMAALAESIFFEVTTPADRERIDFHIGPLPAVVADPTLLRQLWVNLLSNAVKFSSKKPRAEIEVTATATDGVVVYSVQDNGAGFDMQYVNKLFGVFQRLHSSREFEGTGVGLAIVHRIIERHGGQIWAKGKPQHGATFSFTLPNK